MPTAKHPVKSDDLLLRKIGDFKIAIYITTPPEFIRIMEALRLISKNTILERKSQRFFGIDGGTLILSFTKGLKDKFPLLRNGLRSEKIVLRRRGDGIG